MMRFWVIAALTAVTLAVTACGGAPAEDRSQAEAAQGKDMTATTVETDSDDDLSSLRTELDQTQAADGARVTLKWAYADEKFVALGLHTQRLEGTQKPEGSDSSSNSAALEPELEPALWDDTVGDEAELPPYVKITDASGQDFDTVGGGGSERVEAVFDAPKGIEAGKEHRLHLEVPLDTAAGGMPGEKPEAGPFVFNFGVPVLPAPTIEVNQAVEAKGITLTLERVVDSPLLPQAVVCFEPPDDKHRWMPFLRYDESYEEGVASAPQKFGDSCWSLMMAAPVEGRSSVTVTYLEGMPRASSSTDTEKFYPKMIRGPWRFEFEAPGS
jgi:hypothetical protein